MMTVSKTKRNIILGILFFLPVAFLLMLYPATHNYIPLGIVNEEVSEMRNFSSSEGDIITLGGHITVLGFLGSNPIDNATAASNLKELVYDKFKGFKKFQVVLVAPKGSEEGVANLDREISSFEDMRFWHYAFGNENQIKALFSSLKKDIKLKDDLSTQHVFIIDKDLNQRGRIDGRDKKELSSNKPEYSIYSYNTIEVADIKNKMSEDIRILFTEYRQKRKGKFDDSSTRRANDLKQSNE